MRILVLSPFPLMPQLHGGRTRTLGLSAGMARAGADVTVLCPWHPRQPRQAQLEERLVLRTHRLVANALPAVLPRRVASPLALLSLQPRTGSLRRLLRALGHFDVIQFEFCAQALWLEGLDRGVKTVYSAHNVERDFFAAEATRYHLRRWSLRRLEQLERLAVRQSDAVVTCSEHDASRLVELYGQPARTAVVPNGFDRSLLELDRTALRREARRALGFRQRERVLLFLGGEAWHNLEAVDFLVNELLPELDADTRLLVVGTSGRRVSSPDDRVVAVGFVSDLRPHLAAADVGLNPASLTSGSSVKVAYYLGAGLPVITTPSGARGFTELPGLRVVSRAAFADALRDPPPEVVRTASLEDLTWDALGRTLLSGYGRLA
ncbi:MAG: glycosyltransferase family 4 protein [Gaiellaceae bacterium]